MLRWTRFQLRRNKRPVLGPPSSEWDYTIGYLEMNSAREWHLTPSQWYEEPRWSRAVMVGALRVRGTMLYWDAEKAKEESS